MMYCEEEVLVIVVIILKMRIIKIYWNEEIWYMFFIFNLSIVIFDFVMLDIFCCMVDNY